MTDAGAPVGAPEGANTALRHPMPPGERTTAAFAASAAPTRVRAGAGLAQPCTSSGRIERIGSSGGIVVGPALASSSAARDSISTVTRRLRPRPSSLALSATGRWPDGMTDAGAPVGAPEGANTALRHPMPPGERTTAAFAASAAPTRVRAGAGLAQPCTSSGRIERIGSSGGIVVGPALASSSAARDSISTVTRRLRPRPSSLALSATGRWSA